MVGGELVDQLGGIEGAGGKLQVAFQREEAIDSLAADYGIQISTPGQRHQAMGEQFQVPGELASGASDPLGDGLNLAQVRGIEGKDSIRLPQLGLLDDDGFGLISSWLGHFYYRLTSPPVSPSPFQGEGEGLYKRGSASLQLPVNLSKRGRKTELRPSQDTPSSLLKWVELKRSFAPLMFSPPSLEKGRGQGDGFQ